VRWDGGIVIGFEVGLHYDPLLGKLIVHAPTRAAAIRRMARALDEMVIRGIESCVPFHRRVMDEVDFQRGSLSIRYLEDHPELMSGEEEEAIVKAAAVTAALLEEGETSRLRLDPGSQAGSQCVFGMEDGGGSLQGSEVDAVPKDAPAQEVDVHGIGSGGVGVGTLPDGRVIFLPRTAPGDRVLARPSTGEALGGPGERWWRSCGGDRAEWLPLAHATRPATGAPFNTWSTESSGGGREGWWGTPSGELVAWSWTTPPSRLLLGSCAIGTG
jgi:hypothetical protein